MLTVTMMIRNEWVRQSSRIGRQQQPTRGYCYCHRNSLNYCSTTNTTSNTTSCISNTKQLKQQQRRSFASVNNIAYNSSDQRLFVPSSRILIQHNNNKTMVLECKNQIRWFGGGAGGNNNDSDVNNVINVTFLQPDGVTHTTVPAKIGQTLLQVAHANDIDLEGACEGVCACSTCHVIVPIQLYKTLPSPSDDEEDMLDMAFGLTETSRLGCQIKITADMDQTIFTMPKATRNFYVDGHKPKPH